MKAGSGRLSFRPITFISAPFLHFNEKYTISRSRERLP